MSAEFITLTRDDPDFERYLLGTFSRTERALPVETFRSRSTRERVTFRIVPVEKLSRPPWWVAYLWSCRPDLWGLTLGPAVAVWLGHRESLPEWNRWPSWLALVGVFFLHTASFLYNDVQDHLKGTDRLNRRRGSQVIQRGWCSAAEMKRWAGVHLALAAILAVPAFLHAPVGLTAVCVAAAVALALLMGNWGSRFGLGDLALTMLFGPLLTMGVALASFGATTWADAALGLGFGVMATWVFQVRQFENLFRSRPDSFHTFLGRLNFDEARMTMVAEGFFVLAAQPALGLWLALPRGLFSALPVVSIPSILLMYRLFRANSPLSSTLVDSSRWALAAHGAWSLWWIAALGLAWV